MLGADALVWDSVRVMLGSMGYHCVVASTLKEALSLLKVQKPDVAILDPRQVGSPPARMVAAFHKMIPTLRGRKLFSQIKRAIQNSFECSMHIRFPRFLGISFCRGFGPAWIRYYAGILCTAKSRRVRDSSWIVFSSRWAPMPDIRSSSPLADSYTNPRT